MQKMQIRIVLFLVMFVNLCSSLPNDVDWRTSNLYQSNLVTPVKNQSQCDSSYAFAALGALEGQWAKQTRQLISLSAQQIIDCTAQWGNMGCNGGGIGFVFEYLRRYGIQNETTYPYVGKLQTCKMNPSPINSIYLRTVKNIGANNETLLTAAVAEIGPVAAVIDVSPAFFDYRSGVYSCTTTYYLKQSVLVVGYTPTYWIVKNSFGTSWGIGGYMHVARNSSNPYRNCGIALRASFPEF